jgi:hypothetical protein
LYTGLTLLQPRKHYANVPVKPHVFPLSFVACFLFPVHDGHRRRRLLRPSPRAHARSCISRSHVHPGQWRSFTLKSSGR